MTLVQAAQQPATSGGGLPAIPPPSPPSRPARPARPARPVRDAIGSGFWILAITLLGFVGWFAFGSRLYYDRVQHNTYANFRVQLAQAIAPVSPYAPLINSGAATPSAPKFLAPGTPVAIITIPEIGLNAVVFEGTSPSVLEGGPGHVRSTPLPGQTGVSVLSGRRSGYGGPFNRVPTLQQGDTFTVTTGQGVSTYQVLDVRKAGDPVPPAPQAGQGRLILVTADGHALIPSGVVYVDANLTSTAHPAPNVAYPVINASEEALGTDAQAWLPLVLWGQGLLIVVVGLSWCRARWGRWQTWIVAIPVLGFIGLSIADQVTRLLPNIM